MAGKFYSIHHKNRVLTTWMTGLLLLIPVISHAQEEEVLLSFRHPDAGHVYISTLFDHRTQQSFLPVLELFSRLEVHYEPDIRHFTIRGNYLSPDQPYMINLSSMQVMLGNKIIPITRDDYRIGQMDYYIHPRVLEQIFGLRFTVNLMHLSLHLETTHTLPVTERKAREKARKRMEGPVQPNEPYPLLHNRNRKFLGGSMLDYNIVADYTTQSRGLGYSLSGGIEALGGDLQGSLHGVENSNGYSDKQFHNLRWRYAIRDNEYISGITLGQMNTSGIEPWNIRGIAITNEPIEPRQMYETYVIDGNTEPESEVELYINDRISDFRRADELGYYRFDVPVIYGTTRVGLRIYTPSGEVIRDDKQLQVPFSFLPKGSVSYQLQSGKREIMPADTLEDLWISHGVITAGLSKWLTASAGAQHTGDQPDPDALSYYGTLNARISKQYLVSADLAPDKFYRLTSSILYPNNVNINLVYTHFDGISLLNSRGATGEWSVNLYTPVHFLGMQSGLRIGGDQVILDGMRISRYRADFNTRLGNVNLRLNYRDNMVSQGGDHHFGEGILTPSLTYTIQRSPGIPVYVRGMFLRLQSQYDIRNNLLQTADFQLSKTIVKTGRLNAGWSYDFLQRRSNFQIGFTMDLNWVRTASTVLHQNQQFAARQSFTGSLGWDTRNQHIQLSNRQQVGRSAAAVRLYVDNNNSGNFDQGDMLLPFRGVRLDKTATMSLGSDSILRVNQLQNYYRYNLTVNRNAIADPSLVPLQDAFSFIADPNQYKPIDIPFYRGGIIEGTVYIQRDGKQEGQGGLRVSVKAQEGDYQQTVRTFADGTFYMMDVPPGEYQLFLDEAQLGFLGAHPVEPLNIQLRALADGDYLEGTEIVLRVDESRNEQEKHIANQPDNPSVVANQTPVSRYTLQAGAFSDPQNARQLQTKIQSITSFSVSIIEEKGLSKVRVSGFESRKDARSFQQKLKGLGQNSILIE